MNVQGYGKHIRERIREWPVDKPITTDAVAAEMAGVFHIDIVSAKKITNVNMKRLSDKGELVRVQKGIYGNTEDTPLGKISKSAEEIMIPLLLRSGDGTIGHLAGPTLLNEIGLCTQMPEEYHIATNGFRKRIPQNVRISLQKPVIPVNDENVHYLQAIEAITAAEKYPVDAENPNDILRKMLRNNNINNEKLILYVRKHYNHKTLLRTIDVALGGKGL